LGLEMRFNRDCLGVPGAHCFRTFANNNQENINNPDTLQHTNPSEACAPPQGSSLRSQSATEGLGSAGDDVSSIARRPATTGNTGTQGGGDKDLPAHWFNLMPKLALPLGRIDLESPLAAGRNHPIIAALPFEAVPGEDDSEVGSDSEAEGDSDAEADAGAEAEAKAMAAEEDEAEAAEEEELEEQGQGQQEKEEEQEQEQEQEARPGMSLGSCHGDGRSSPTVTAAVAVATTDAPLATSFQPSAEAAAAAQATGAPATEQQGTAASAARPARAAENAVAARTKTGGGSAGADPCSRMLEKASLPVRYFQLFTLSLAGALLLFNAGAWSQQPGKSSIVMGSHPNLSTGNVTTMYCQPTAFPKSGSEDRLADFTAQLEKDADFHRAGQGREGGIKAFAQVSRQETGSLATRQNDALQRELPALQQLSLSLGNQSAPARSEDQNISHRSASGSGSESSPPAVPALGAALAVGAGAAEPQTALRSGAAGPALRLCASPVFVNLLGSISTACGVAAGGQGLQRVWARFAAALWRSPPPQSEPSRRTDAKQASSGRQWWAAQDRSWWEQRDAPWWKQQVDPWWTPQAGQWRE